MPKPNPKITTEEETLIAAIKSTIFKEKIVMKAPKTIYLQHRLWKMFVDLNRKCFTEEELEAAGNKFSIQDVRIEKGDKWQTNLMLVEHWEMDKEIVKQALA